MLLKGANSFLQELAPIERGDNDDNGRLASPGNVSIHPWLFSYMFLLEDLEFEDPIERGDKDDNGRVTSPGNISIHPWLFSYMFL